MNPNLEFKIVTKIVDFEVIRLMEDERPVILIYALGQDGILYEMSGGRWIALPIGENVPTVAQVQAEQALQPRNRNRRNNE